MRAKGHGNMGYRTSLMSSHDNIVTNSRRRGRLPKSRRSATREAQGCRHSRLNHGTRQGQAGPANLLHDHRVHAKDIGASGIYHDANPMQARASKSLQPREVRQQLGGAVQRLVQFEEMGIAMDK